MQDWTGTKSQRGSKTEHLGSQVMTRLTGPIIPLLLHFANGKVNLQETAFHIQAVSHTAAAAATKKNEIQKWI